MKLNDKVAVITGAGSGIGRALAVSLATRGCRLMLNDARGEALEETLALLGPTDEDSIRTQIFDVADWQAMEAFASKVAEHFGQVDLVINNAGVALGAYHAESVPIEDFKWLMDVNFWGMVYGSKAFLPHLKQRPEACLVNISSILGLLAVAKQSPYCASKFAIRGFTESLRMEAMMEFPHVNIMSVHPGGIKTNIARHSKWDKSDLTQEEREAMTAEFEKSFINTPDYAARTILKGVEKRKKRVIVGNDAWWMSKIAWWFPVSYTRVLIHTFMRKYDLQTRQTLEVTKQL